MYPPELDRAVRFTELEAVVFHESRVKRVVGPHDFVDKGKDVKMDYDTRPPAGTAS